MVKTYKFNNTELERLIKTIGDFKISKLSDIISFLNTEQVSKKEDKVYINDNLTFDLKLINHDNNANFDFDMDMEIGSGYTFDIVNANTKDNNIQYINFNKSLINKGTIIIGHLSCNNGQFVNEKKGIIKIKSIFYNGINTESKAIFTNNGEFTNERTFHNNAEFINNSLFIHEDNQNIQSHNNKTFTNNNIMTLSNGEFINAEKKETNLTPNLDDNLDTINPEDDIKHLESETSTDTQTFNNKDGHFNNNGKMEIVKCSFKTSGEFNNENGIINISEGALEILNGNSEFIKSSITLNNGLFFLSKGEINVKDNSDIIINNGTYKMSSGILNLYNDCKFKVNGGKIVLNKSFNILGGELSFIQDKFDTNNYKLNLITSILDTETANVDQKLNFLIESETVENNVKSLIDDNYILKSDVEKQLQDLREIKDKEIEELKADFIKQYDKKILEIKEEYKHKEEEIKKLQGELNNLKNNMTNNEPIKLNAKAEIKAVEKQEIKKPTFIPKTYELTLNYDESSGKVIPIIQSEKIMKEEEETEEEKKKAIKEAEDIITDLLDDSEESDSRVSRAKEKILSKIKTQTTFKKAKTFASTLANVLRMKVSANYVLKSVINEKYIAKEEIVKTNYIKTYSKTINHDDTKTINKIDQKNITKTITKYEKPKSQIDMKKTVSDVIKDFTTDDKEIKQEKQTDENKNNESLKPSQIKDIINTEKSSIKQETATKQRSRNLSAVKRLNNKPLTQNVKTIKKKTINNGVFASLHKK